MKQILGGNKYLKSYRIALYATYGASLLSFILAQFRVSDGLWTDIITYLIFALAINIFKNKLAGLIVAILSAIQFIFVLISIGAGNSTLIELVISAAVFASLFSFYKLVREIGSIKKINK